MKTETIPKDFGGSTVQSTTFIVVDGKRTIKCIELETGKTARKNNAKHKEAIQPDP